jgi:hypothetical protein
MRTHGQRHGLITHRVGRGVMLADICHGLRISDRGLGMLSQEALIGAIAVRCESVGGQRFLDRVVELAHRKPDPGPAKQTR